MVLNGKCIVMDSSTDKTPKIAERLGARVYRVPKNGLAMHISKVTSSMSSKKRKMLETMVELAYKLKVDLQENRLDTFGEIL